MVCSFLFYFLISLLLLVKKWRRLVKLYLSYSDCFSHIWVAWNSFHLLGIQGHSDFTVWGFRIYSGLQCCFAGLPTTREYVTTSLRPLQHSFLRSHSLSTSMTRRVQVPSAFSSLCCCDFVCVFLFSSVQDGIPMLGRAHMLSTPSLRHWPQCCCFRLICCFRLTQKNFECVICPKTY